MQQYLRPIAFSFDVPVFATAKFQRNGRDRYILGAMAQDILVPQIPIEETTEAAVLKLPNPRRKCVVRMFDGDYMVSLPVAVAAGTSIPFIPSSNINVLPSKEQFSALSRSADWYGLRVSWDEWKKKALPNILNIRGADLESIKAQRDAQLDYLRSLRVIGGELYRPCVEPFLRLDRSHPNKLVLAFDWSGYESTYWGIYALAEHEQALAAGVFMAEKLGLPKPRPGYEVLSLNEDFLHQDTFGIRLALLSDVVLSNFQRGYDDTPVSYTAKIASLDEVQQSRITDVAALAGVRLDWSAANRLRSRCEFLLGDDLRPFEGVFSKRLNGEISYRRQVLCDEVDNIRTAFRF